MRIAAKRLRYVLEVTGVPLRPVRGDRDEAREGAAGSPRGIHDCDEMLPRVRAVIDELREGDIDG